MLRMLALELAACLSFLAPLAQGQSGAATPAGEATAVSAESASAVPDAVGDEFSGDDWASIRAAYDAGRYAAFTDDGEHHARNPGQRWTTRFDGRGFTTSPDAGEWTWGLELEAYGWGAVEPVATPAAVTTNGQLVSYDWNEWLTEWYVNDRRGLEHGYTVHARPESASGALALELSVRGALLPVISENGRDVRFVDATGESVLTYAGLTVFDADGQTLSARWRVVGERLHLLVEDQAARYPLTIDPIAQQAYLKGSNTEAGDNFGWSVAVCGHTVVVGAGREDSAATGVNGDGSNNALSNAGAAYVFVRSGTTWTQEAYLKASNTGAGDGFGGSVSVCGDTVVVGAPGEASSSTGVNGDQSSNAATNAGAAYVFVRKGTTWTQEAYLKASNTGAGDGFGGSVSVCGDTVVVGAPGEDSAATGVDGDQSSNFYSLSGAAYVFVRRGTSWAQEAYLKASNTGVEDYFGVSVAVSGDTVVVGAYGERSLATGVNGDQDNDDAFWAPGAAYVFVRSGTTWTQQAYLKASNTEAGDVFGWSVSVCDDTAVVGAHLEDSSATGVNGDQNVDGASNSGAAYVFVRSGTVWTQEAYLKASNTGAEDWFGLSVSVSGDTVIVGSQRESSAATGVDGNQNNNAANSAGAAYVFVRNGTTWSQRAYLKASNTGASDGLGSSVAVSGDTVVLAAPFEDSDATGVNGDQRSNAAGNAGAVYVFELDVFATCTLRNGILGLNPADFTCTSFPKLGTTWTSEIATTPLVGDSTSMTLVACGAPLEGVHLYGYELLVMPGGQISISATGCHEWLMPSDPALIGAPFASQGIRVETTGSTNHFVLTNALDLVLGY